MNDVMEAWISSDEDVNGNVGMSWEWKKQKRKL